MPLNNKEAFLTIVRIGIGHSGKALLESVGWNELEDLAAEQGFSAVLVDGIEKIPEGQRPPKAILLQWIGGPLQGYEYRYELYCRTIAEMAAFYNEHGYKMMVLKGYACSLDWPKPEHRPCGDIDIWQFGRQKEADAILAKEKSIKIDRSHHHHTVFDWRDFMVENHYDFVNVYVHKSSRELEEVSKNWARMILTLWNCTGRRFIYRVQISTLCSCCATWFPHFAAANITLRQVLDWAFFVKAHTKEIDWKWLVDLLEKYHMKDFYNCLNAICVENLGFPVQIFPQVQFDPVLKERVLNDILDPAFTAKAPKGFVRRLLFKYRRWKRNGWKQELCYNESRASYFWSGICAKFRKPSSF